MSCCNVIEGIAKGCDSNSGGIKKVYIVNKCHVSGSTISDGVITSIGLSGGTTFAEFEFNKNSSSFIEEGAMSLENGSTVHTVTTSLMIPRREVAKRNALLLLTAGHPDLWVIIEDNNGIFWLQGYLRGANVTALGEGSGVALADGSKYSMTITSEEIEQMPEVDAQIIPSLI
jgi:hypothetical protein